LVITIAHSDPTLGVSYFLPRGSGLSQGLSAFWAIGIPSPVNGPNSVGSPAVGEKLACPRSSPSLPGHYDGQHHTGRYIGGRSRLKRRRKQLGDWGEFPPEYTYHQVPPFAKKEAGSELPALIGGDVMMSIFPCHVVRRPALAIDVCFQDPWRV
jgi:hypothetical protein